MDLVKVYSRFNLKRIQRCWDKFFEASGVQSTQQARKIYTSRVLQLSYLFYIERTILNLDDNRHYAINRLKLLII